LPENSSGGDCDLADDSGPDYGPFRPSRYVCAEDLCPAKLAHVPFIFVCRRPGRRIGQLRALRSAATELCSERPRRFVRGIVPSVAHTGLREGHGKKQETGTSSASGTGVRRERKLTCAEKRRKRRATRAASTFGWNTRKPAEESGGSGGGLSDLLDFDPRDKTLNLGAN